MESGSNAFVKLLIQAGVLGKDQVVDADSLARQTNIPLAEALVKLAIGDGIARPVKRGPALFVPKHLGELSDAAQELYLSLVGRGIARNGQLGDVADPADRRVCLFRVDGIAQPEDIGAGREY